MSDIWAGRGLDRDSFVISTGDMEDDPQFSRVSTFSPGSAEKWTYKDFDATIMSLAVLPDQDIVALGIDGDVFVIGESTESEKIPNSGTIGELDEEAPGSLEKIRSLGDLLLVCGDGAQVFQRDNGGRWTSLGGATELADASFNDVNVNAAGRIAVCGDVSAVFREPSPQEKTELDRIRETGTLGDLTAARGRYERMLEPPRGCLFISEEAKWGDIQLPGTGYLNALHVLPDDRFLVVGGGGQIVCGNDVDNFEDVSLFGINETLRAIQQLEEGVVLLGDTCLLVLTAGLELKQTISLPEGLMSPVDITVINGNIWYFDHQGVARFQDNAWELMHLPDTVFRSDD